jgi:ankyrin repeat protein
MEVSSPTNKFDEFVTTVFHNPAAAAAFLAEYPTILKAKNSIGETALHFLVIENAINSVHCLLKLGADINTTNESGETPLFNAAQLGYLEMCCFLLEHGANPQIADYQGDTALSFAAEYGKLSVVKLLLGQLGETENINEYFESSTAWCLLEEDSDISSLLKARGLINPFS